MTAAAKDLRELNELSDSETQELEPELSSPYTVGLTQGERWEMIVHTENEGIRQKVLEQYYIHATKLGELQRVYQLAETKSDLETMADLSIKWMR